MELWIVWAIIALVALLVEIFTAGFAVVCFAVGGFATSVAAALGVSVMWQMGIFSISTILALILIRPLMLRFLSRDGRGRPVVETNASALVGRRAIVTQPIRGGVGRVSIDGDDWKAEIEDLEAEIEVGQRVEIERVESVILIVKR